MLQGLRPTQAALLEVVVVHMSQVLVLQLRLQLSPPAVEALHDLDVIQHRQALHINSCFCRQPSYFLRIWSLTLIDIAPIVRWHKP